MTTSNWCCNGIVLILHSRPLADRLSEHNAAREQAPLWATHPGLRLPRMIPCISRTRAAQVLTVERIGAERRYYGAGHFHILRCRPRPTDVRSAPTHGDPG